MNYLLKIKHWQLLAIMLLPTMFLDSFASEDMSIWSLIGSIWLLIVYLLWLYSVGNVEYEGKRNVTIFQACFLYSIIYCVFILYAYNIDKTDFPYWHIPIHLLALIASFYILYFATNTFVSFRKLRGEKEMDFFSTFIAFWFFPIGVFFIQPKLNDAINAKSRVREV